MIARFVVEMLEQLQICTIPVTCALLIKVVVNYDVTNVVREKNSQTGFVQLGLVPGREAGCWSLL